MPPYEPRPQQGERQHTAETVRETHSKNTERPQTNSRPSAHRRPTAKSRPTYASMTRQPTSNTLQEHGLAGPPAYSQNQRREDTHYDKGYEEANPWMQEQEDSAGFSLAGNFPRTVRWRNKREDDGSHEKVEADQKGETETAPQVQGAEDQANGDDTDPVDYASSFGEEESIKRQKFEAHQQGGGNLRASRTMSHQTANAQYPPNIRPFNWWAGFRMKHQRPLAEFLGMVVFMFLGISANLSVYVSEKQSGTQQTVWWTWGFAVMIGIYIAGGSSGAFLNPMIVMVLAVFRGFPARRIPVYIFIQILGAFIGSLLAFAVFRDSILNLDGALLSETTGVNFYTQPQADYISVHTAFIVEMLGSAVIACTILALGDSGNSPPGAGMHAFIIGLLITTTCMALGWITRGCFNPARDLGPRLAALAVGYPLHSFTDWANFWIWGAWCAPMVGGLIGGVAYDACVFKGGESPVNYSGGLWKKKALHKEGDFFAHILRNPAKAEDIDRRLESGELQTVESSAAREDDMPPSGHGDERERSSSGSGSAESRRKDDMTDAYLASRFNRTE